LYPPLFNLDNFDGKLIFNFTPRDIIYNTICGNLYGCLPQIPCYLLDPKFLTVEHIHFGPDANKDVTDNLHITGGAGTFIGVLKDSFKFPIDLSRVE